MTAGKKVCFFDGMINFRTAESCRGPGASREYESIFGIDQYYLIRSVKPEADRFYHGFKGAELSEEPLLRKEIKTGENL